MPLEASLATKEDRPPPNVSAETAVLMDLESQRMLFGKQPHKQMRIASITKIMTALLAIESTKWDEEVTVSALATRQEGSSLYLQQGEKIKLKHLVYGLMLRSGNDAAVAIAEHVGGSVDGFVFMMNQRARQIGMTNTIFNNPHGLDDHEEHFSTAFDMALLTREAMKNDQFREVSSTKLYQVKDPDGPWNRVWKNKNKLLTTLYPHSTGGKTGFTKRARRTLVSTAEKEGEPLVVVTLNASSDWADHQALFEWGFSQFDWYTVLDKDERLDRKSLQLEEEYAPAFNVVLPLRDSEKEDVTIDLRLGDTDSFADVSIAKEQVTTVRLVKHEPPPKPGFFKRLFGFFHVGYGGQPHG
ncbi:D-alanyl-D-alanine carboxypeptidase family protein [Aureibacillus halotolerans]|nr:D-alanyl-D-alanine carboxypeptidase family protein [Aureibacillus halotolerans]